MNESINDYHFIIHITRITRTRINIDTIIFYEHPGIVNNLKICFSVNNLKAISRKHDIRFFTVSCTQLYTVFNQISKSIRKWTVAIECH